MNGTRINFNFDGELRESLHTLSQIICSSHWTSEINPLNSNHQFLIGLLKQNIIVIDEHEYECPPASIFDGIKAKEIESMLGKRSSHPVMQKMAVLFANHPLERADCFRNTIFVPTLKAYVRADGMKPEDVAEMFRTADKIILFPYYTNDGKSVFHELSLGVEREAFEAYMDCEKERQFKEMAEAMQGAVDRAKASVIS